MGRIESIVSNLTWCRSVTRSLFEDWPPAERAAQRDGAPNHLIWTLGHLAASYDWATNVLDGSPKALPEAFHAAFAFGTHPSGDASDYPPFAEVQAAFDSAFERFVAAARRISDDQAGEPPAAGASDFARTKEDLVVRSLWHEGWHAGQLSALRRAMGLKPLFSAS